MVRGGAPRDRHDHDHLSYMEKRLENLFGRLRKDFYGEISAQSLGPKYGDYGTFLPTSVIEIRRSNGAFQNRSDDSVQTISITDITNLKRGVPSKRPREADIFDSDPCQKRKKFRHECLMGPDQSGAVTSKSAGSDKMPSTGSSGVVEEQNGSEKSSLLLEEARDFKHRADRLQKVGEDALATTLYFEAALKFLDVASLWEHKPGEPNQDAVQMYSDTAKFCQCCASLCENQKNMAAAALAYKAVEVACMRAAFLRSPAQAGKEAACLGEQMTSAFLATQQYQILIQREELATSILKCLNTGFYSTNSFIELARQALESIG